MKYIEIFLEVVKKFMLSNHPESELYLIRSNTLCNIKHGISVVFSVADSVGLFSK